MFRASNVFSCGVLRHLPQCHAFVPTQPPGCVLRPAIIHQSNHARSRHALCSAHPGLTGARAPQEARARFAGCAADLTVVATLAAGNDYLPALRSASLQGSLVTPSLWTLYLRLRSQREWAGRCAARLPGRGF